MVEATSVTLRQLTNVGEDMLYEIATTSASSTNTLTIPTVNTEITTSSVVKIVSVNNTTDGTSQGDITTDYSDSSRQFTVTESGMSGDAVRIEFRVVNNG